jgi:hypothetical protein
VVIDPGRSLLILVAAAEDVFDGPGVIRDGDRTTSSSCLKTKIEGVGQDLLVERWQNSVCATPRLDLGLGHGALGSRFRDLVSGWKQLEVAVGW